MLLEIAGRAIGPAAPVFVVAEIGLNHGGSPARALAMVDAAAAAGASAVKLQTLDASALVAAECPAPAHVAADSLRDFFRQFELDVEAHRAVVQRARAHGLAVLTTPLSEAALPMLEPLGFDAYKIASGDLTYDGLIAATAATGRPLVLSTGMSELDEVRRALDVARRAGARQLALLHCVSAYPTPVDAQNLRAVVTLAEATGVPVGLSDHGTGLLAAVAAVALGACLYERHFVLADDVEAIDRAVSSTPDELRAIVHAMASTRAALGDGVKRCLPAEVANRTPSRRGVYATRTLAAGEVLRPGDLAALRPATSLPPSAIAELTGTILTRDVDAGAPLTFADLRQPELV